MFIDGFKFGMMLQFAIGPVCLYILNVSLSGSLSAALSGMVGVTLVDGLFVMLAFFGIGNLVNQSDKATRILRYVGGSILIIFGMIMLYSTVKSYMYNRLSHEANYFSSYHVSAGRAFVSATLLTLSSPLTIVFWGGVFATKITNEKLSRKQLYIFGLGAVSSTIFSLTFVALIASRLAFVFNPISILILNSLVAILLVGYGVRQIANKK